MKTVYLVFRERLRGDTYSLSKIISAHPNRKDANSIAKLMNERSKDGWIIYTVKGIPFVKDTGEI
jgi:hypothetical protein